ncbi:MAG TPA: hypothetical protein VHU23_12030 [Rhizomicrobium sp.]|jgi:hypothetical protein|nr:hypothetical protein [Rhizomicrobium sp.]
METPIHAANDVDRNERMPRIVAAVAGIVLVGIVVVGLTYSGLWSPPATTHTAQAAAPAH